MIALLSSWTQENDVFVQEEAIRCRSRLETEKQNLTEEIGSLQKSLNKEKGVFPHLVSTHTSHVKEDTLDWPIRLFSRYVL
jgi:hypothetical protein